MVIKPNPISNLRPDQLRPFDARRDLNVVADLIESSFSLTLDADGRRYLRRMREAASRKKYKGWSGWGGRSRGYALSGFVWEEDGMVVGNLSLVPFIYKRQKIYLIANVAVKQEYRRRGIAQALTTAALERCRQRKVDATWLQVRHDNEAAENLYLKRGFNPQARRTTWIASQEKLKRGNIEGYNVTFRRLKHWPFHRTWLGVNYPENLRWHYFNHFLVINPSYTSIMTRLLDDSIVRHWVVQQGHETLGIMSWHRSHRYTDRLWLAAPPEHESAVLNAVVPRLKYNHRFTRQITLDYPDGQASETLSNLGFERKTTLIWMEVKHK